MHIIDAITKSVRVSANDHHVIKGEIQGKPVVTHNALMDVLYTYRTFIDDLPPTWRQFCAAVLKVFPHIYDTKCVCAGEDFVVRVIGISNTHSSPALSQSVLGKNPSLFVLNDKTRKPPFGDVHYAPTSPNLDVGDNARHTAAYDAHITGRVFIALTRFKYDQIVNGMVTVCFLSSYAFLPAQNLNPTTSSTPATHAQVMEEAKKCYVNKCVQSRVCISKAIALYRIARVGRIMDMSGFDLLQPDELPDRCECVSLHFAYKISYTPERTSSICKCRTVRGRRTMSDN